MRRVAVAVVVAVAVAAAAAVAGDGGNDNCSSSAKLVYVVDASNTFSQFDLSTKTFSDLGTLSCPHGGMPFSMGVDRNTIAWVLYSTGELMRVDITNNLACTQTSWDNPALLQFGMGFSSDASGGTADTLFISGGPMSTLSPTSMSRGSTRPRRRRRRSARSPAGPSSPVPRPRSCGAGSPIRARRAWTRSTRRTARSSRGPSRRSRPADRVGVRVLGWRLLDLPGEGLRDFDDRLPDRRYGRAHQGFGHRRARGRSWVPACRRARRS